MNPTQISHRLLSVLPFEKTMTIVLKPGAYFYQYGRYTTHVRWFYSSFKSEKTIRVNEGKTNQMLISTRMTSIAPIVHPCTSFTTKFSSKQIISKSKSIWQRIIYEFKHYYHGFKLLCIETKIAVRLLHRILNGHTLTRRERKQFIRTVGDLFRLVPFSVFIIVPFMEFTLPIFLKLFPNMLPSTFKQIDKEKENLKKQSKIKFEVIQFLQETLQDMIFQSQERYWKDTLTIQFNIRPSVEEIIKFSSLFSNQLTLDNLSRPQLIGLSKLLNLSFLGPNSYLRLKLHLKFHRLKFDDQLIANEGIDNLNIEELHAACHERGINSFDINIEHLKSQLQQWIDLHINKCIPINILLLSNVFYLSSIDMDRFRIGLEQLVNQKTDFKEYQEDINRHTINKLVGLPTQISHKRQEMY